MRNPFSVPEAPEVHPHPGSTMHAYGFHDDWPSIECVHCVEEDAVKDPLRIYIDRDDRWVGYYRGVDHHYVCLLPCIVIRWRRRP